MYRTGDLITDLFPLCGWRQHFDTDDFAITERLTVSESGQYFQDVHPLLTLQNLKAIAPEFKSDSAQNWNANTSYSIGDKVTYNYKRYRAIASNSNKNPETQTAYWELFDLFSEWLEQKTKGSIIKAVQRLYDFKLAERTAKSILEGKTLFNGAGRIYDTITSSDSLVGLELVPIRSEGITLKINKIGLQLSGAADIVLYLMHSSCSEPIKTITCSKTGASAFQWFEQTDLYLPYASASTDAGGSWYLVYDQTSLPEGVQAINKNKDWSAKPCSSCDYNELANWRVWSQYLEVYPFKTGSYEISEEVLGMWDVADNVYCMTSNWGLNLQITIECDITDILISQRHILQSLVSKQVAVDMLRELAYNSNFNITRAQQNFSRQEILYEIDGDSQGYKKSGLAYELAESFKAINVDLTRLSKTCFPCGNKGVRYTAI